MTETLYGANGRTSVVGPNSSETIRRFLCRAPLKPPILAILVLMLLRATPLFLLIAPCARSLPYRSNALTNPPSSQTRSRKRARRLAYGAAATVTFLLTAYLGLSPGFEQDVIMVFALLISPLFFGAGYLLTVISDRLIDMFVVGRSVTISIVLYRVVFEPPILAFLLLILMRFPHLLILLVPIALVPYFVSRTR